ncbi:hypothetical protein [Natrinema amylolyticum]|nr:hypothetical protein [Natrinema amylolyticum]
MAVNDQCPNCEGDDVWLEERAHHIQYSCNQCNHHWKRDKDT